MLTLKDKIRKWLFQEHFIQDIFSKNAISKEDWSTIQLDKKLTKTGSNLLHLLAANPYCKDVSITNDLMAYLIEERYMDVNLKDEYGRTPLVNYIISNGRLWNEKDSLDKGLDGIALLLENGANPDVLFTPSFVQAAGCEKWGLVHHSEHAADLFSYFDMPQKMKNIFNDYCWNINLRDSEGRTYKDYPSYKY